MGRGGGDGAAAVTAGQLVEAAHPAAAVAGRTLEEAARATAPPVEASRLALGTVRGVAADSVIQRRLEAAAATQPQAGCPSKAQGTAGAEEKLQVVRLGRPAVKLSAQEGCPLPQVAEGGWPKAGCQLLVAACCCSLLAAGCRPQAAGCLALREGAAPRVVEAGHLSTMRPLGWYFLAGPCSLQACRVAAVLRAGCPLQPAQGCRELRRSAQTAAAAQRPLHSA